MTKELIQKYVLNPKIILEFGSYDGADTIRYKNYFQKAKVFAIEPDPFMYKVLKKNVKGKGIFTFQYAVTDKTGEVNFYESKFTREVIIGKKSGEPSFAGSLYNVSESAKQQNFQIFSEVPLKVPSITIKDFCKQQSIDQVDFMHCDVEGSLKKVLNGFGKIKPILIFAETSGFGMYIGVNTQKEYHQMFEKLGYIKVQNMQENTLYYKNKGIKE